MPAVEGTPEARAALKRYAEMTFGDLSDTERMAEYVYNVGWRDAVAFMVAFRDLGGSLDRIERRVHDLGELVRRHTPAIEREVEDGSAYWSSSLADELGVHD